MRKAIALSLLLLVCSCQRTFAADTSSLASPLSGDISAQTLITEVQKNQIRFDKKYKGSQITTVGFVGSMKERKDGYSLFLYGEAHGFRYIDCRFPASEEEALLDLNRGEIIRVTGTYSGKEDLQHSELMLHDCVVARNEK